MRSFYGDRFKTFFDLDLNVHALPIVTIGPRVAFGVQYELLNVIGAFACAGVQFGVGPAGARIGFEVMDTPAACRTYNVLLAEGRAVVAALLFERGG